MCFGTQFIFTWYAIRLQNYYYFLNIGSIPSLKMSKIGFIHFVLSAFCSNFAFVFENNTYRDSR